MRLWQICSSKLMPARQQQGGHDVLTWTSKTLHFKQQIWQENKIQEKSREQVYTLNVYDFLYALVRYITSISQLHLLALVD